MVLKLFSRAEPTLAHVVVTSFHAAGYAKYGAQCIETFLARWPTDVSLWVYAEDVAVETSDPRLCVLDHVATLPKLRQFRDAYRANPYATGTDPHGSGRSGDFRWDAVRFANKVFAITDAIRRARTMPALCAGQLLWLDADTVTHTDIPVEFLDRMAPRGPELAAYLNRRTYPECGWVGYNLAHPQIGAFIERFEQIYLSGDFLDLKESHDSYVFWMVVKEFETARLARFKHLGDSRARGHIFINSPLGAYVDHLKGDRKEAGRSRDEDRFRTRKLLWWR